MDWADGCVNSIRNPPARRRGLTSVGMYVAIWRALGPQALSLVFTVFHPRVTMAPGYLKSKLATSEY